VTMPKSAWSQNVLCQASEPITDRDDPAPSPQNSGLDDIRLADDEMEPSVNEDPGNV
jgi:hypothetical protein